MSYILLVDDNHFVNTCISQLLKKEGYEIRTALNGKIALDLVRNETPALIICDIHMPVMDGYDFVKCLRDAPGSRSTPVIMHTSVQEEKEQSRFLGLGISFYLNKPCSNEVLLHAVRISYKKSFLPQHLSGSKPNLFEQI